MCIGIGKKLGLFVGGCVQIVPTYSEANPLQGASGFPDYKDISTQ